MVLRLAVLFKVMFGINLPLWENFGATEKLNIGKGKGAYSSS